MFEASLTFLLSFVSFVCSMPKMGQVVQMLKDEEDSYSGSFIYLCIIVSCPHGRVIGFKVG